MDVTIIHLFPKAEKSSGIFLANGIATLLTCSNIIKLDIQQSTMGKKTCLKYRPGSRLSVSPDLVRIKGAASMFSLITIILYLTLVL